MEALTLVKHEVKRLVSQNPDRSLKYPGEHEFTWIKPPGMPWLLVGINPLAQSTLEPR
jgi:hypothetical protein